MIYHLHSVDVMNDEWFYSQMITFCPYCNTINENGMEYSEEKGKWMCRRSGARV